MSHDATRKFIQINHLALQISNLLSDLNNRIEKPVIIDFGCGKGYLTFLLSWLYQHQFKKDVSIIGIDFEPKRIEKIKKIAAELAFDTIIFQYVPIDQFTPPARTHAVFALHACDTATDQALGYCIQNNVDLFAVAPCCQLELNRQWKKMAEDHISHPFAPIFNSPQLRKDIAAEMTDALRMEGMRACGYEVTVSEFVGHELTPKNRLLTGIRRGRFHQENRAKLLALKESLGGSSLCLDNFIDRHFKA